MGRVFAAVAGLMILASAGALLAVPARPGPGATSGPMSLWEAYSRGLITVTQVDVTFDPGTGPITATLGYEAASTAGVVVHIDEFVVLLSPNPRESSPGETSQDGILVRMDVPAGGTVTYMYGDMVAAGILPTPAWWCTEEKQYVKADIEIALGGEILPFELEGLVQTRIPGAGGTQEQLWEHLRTEPTVVVGKTVDGAFWREVPEFAGQSLSVNLRATNLAVKDTSDGFADPDAPAARVWDIVPTGFTLDFASIQPSGSTTTPMPDGSTRISWDTNLPAADVTGMLAGEVPTPYVSRSFSYLMTTPHLTPGRLGLPRAQVSEGADFNAEAHSAQPLLDVLRVPMPPVVDAGGPYESVEGDAITFIATASDPNLDPLQYRWDFTADGTWDTAWSSSASTSVAFGDDLSATIRVEVSDGSMTSAAEAPLVVRNASPMIGDVRATASGDMTLRVAGEKWHDVRLDITQGAVSTTISVTRMPGSPDDQAASLADVEIDLTQEVSLTVYYTPEDDPVNGQPNGADPVWVIFRTSGGEVRLHHTFNVRHADTWTWSLDDILPALVGSEVRLRVDASDVGSDDLTFTVEWGDGTTATVILLNGLVPDPNPSPDVNPIAATETFQTSYAAPGSYAIRVTVSDDDGASATTTLSIVLG